MPRFRIRVISIALLMAITMLAVPATAFAGVSEYQVQFAPVGINGSMDVIVNVLLSPETKLPAKVRIPMPAGATLVWAGEILDGPPEDDPARETTITQSGGAQIVEFTMEEVRVAQIEAIMAPAAVSGDNVSALLDWVNSTEAGTYTFSVRLAPNVSEVEISPKPVGTPQMNEEGETLYVLEPIRLEEGGKFPIEVAYRNGVAGSSSAISPVLLVAIVLLVIAVAALVVVVVRQQAPRGSESGPVRDGRPTERTTARPTSPDSSEDEDEAFTWD